MRRTCSWLATAAILAICAPDLVAQSARPWSIGLTGALVNFRGASSDPVAGISVRPSQGGDFGVALLRESGAWTASVGVGTLATYIEGVTDDLLAQVRSEGFDRLRFAAHIGRRIAPLGQGTIELRAGPTLDYWSVDGDDGRARIGGEGQLAVRFAVGRFQVQNHVGIGWSPSPFDEHEILDGYRLETLRAVTAGMTLWLGL